MKLNFSIGLLFFVCSLILTSESLYSQTNFKEGLVVTISGDTLKGEINFLDWNRSPTSIDFKETPTSKPVSFTPEDIEFFSAAGKRYVARFVTIDQTPIRVSDQVEVTPTQKEERVFLKVLVRGTVSLYEFKSYRVNYYIEIERKITELISHQYVISRGGQSYLVDQNKYKYQQQLKQLGTCEDKPDKRLEYKAKNLQEYLANCNLEEPKVLFYENKKEVIILEQTLFTGVGVTSYSHAQTTRALVAGVARGFGSNRVEFTTINDIEKLEYEVDLSFNIGYKARFILPGDLRRNSVSLSVTISDYSYKAESEFNDLSFTMSTTELQRISNVESSFNTLDLSLWYSKRIKPSRESHFFEFGITFSSVFNEEATAFFDAITYSNSDLYGNDFTSIDDVPVQGTQQDVRNLDLNNQNPLIGLFGGIGYETPKIYSVFRGGLSVAGIGGLFFEGERIYHNNYLSLSLGYKL